MMRSSLHLARLCALILVAALAAACSEGNTMTGASSVGTGTTTATAPDGDAGTIGTLDNRPAPGLPPFVGNPGNSCGNDLPIGLVANAQGQVRVRPNGIRFDSVLFGWVPVANRNSYEAQVRVYDATNVWITLPASSFNSEGPQHTRTIDEGRYEFRVRARAAGGCTEPGPWSKFEGFSVPGAPVATPPAEPPSCEKPKGWGASFYGGCKPWTKPGRGRWGRDS